MADDLNMGGLGALRVVLQRSIEGVLRLEELGRTDTHVAGRRDELLRELRRELGRVDWYSTRLTLPGPSNVISYPGLARPAPVVGKIGEPEPAA